MKQNLIEGVCGYCGQIKMVAAKDQQQADILATENCTCDDAVRTRREQGIKGAIKVLFEDALPEQGIEPTSSLERELIFNGAMSVLNGTAGKISYSLICGDQATVSRKKGDIVIERTHSVKMIETV